MHQSSFYYLQITVKQCQYFTMSGHKNPTLFEKSGIGHWGKDHVGCPMATDMFLNWHKFNLSLCVIT